MATSLTVTTQDLLDALASATNAPEEARTVPELARATGIAEKRVREALRAYQAQGRLGVHRVVRPAIDGRQSRVAAYTIAPAPKAKAKR